MKRKALLSLLTAGWAAALTSLQAGTLVSAPSDKKVQVQEEKSSFFPDDLYLSNITLGAKFSEDLSGVYYDGILGLYATQERDAFLFFDTRYHYEDNGQLISSNGLGFRKRIADRDIIIGVNAFFDQIDSQFDNEFRQLGLGAEILTRYVDWRFNYYLPDNERYEIDRFTRRDRSVTRGFGGLTEVNRLRAFKRYEEGLEGFNTEIGFLIPGLDKYAEVRVFGGYHSYDNPFGDDFEGFQARLEARLLRGVIVDVEYSDDEYLMGGHWTAGVRVNLPFSFLRLIRGRNPFEGWGDQFKPGVRDFQERMGEMIVRSHRVQTVASDDVKVRDVTERFARGAVAGPGGPGTGGPLPVPFE